MNNRVVVNTIQDMLGRLPGILADLSHPIQGTLLLLLLAVIFRWRWPMIWNKFLKRISADFEN